MVNAPTNIARHLKERRTSFGLSSANLLFPVVTSGFSSTNYMLIQLSLSIFSFVLMYTTIFIPYGNYILLSWHKSTNIFPMIECLYSINVTLFFFCFFFAVLDLKMWLKPSQQPSFFVDSVEVHF